MSPGVLAPGDQFEMLWIHTGLSPTEMVDLQSRRNDSVDKFIGDAMDEKRWVARSIAAMSPACLAVSVSILRALPNPTRTVFVRTAADER